ncbi:MAG TPA: hypothetical protein VLA20_10255 [Vicinamibacterales bacterium]|nr:hypothetical protein [Vicinamibacterales bacterium]
MIPTAKPTVVLVKGGRKRRMAGPADGAILADGRFIVNKPDEKSGLT